jgi:hypothetical protein
MFVTLAVLILSSASWSTVPSASPSVYGNRLNAAAAVGSDVWAVGTMTTNSGTTSLIERWDGSNWSAVSSPNRGTCNNVLNAIDDTWAVGFFNDCSSSKTLAVHWDGANWSTVATPNAAAPANSVLLGVAELSANDAWAVGYTYGDSAPGTSPPAPLIEHWNGSSWTIVPSPQSTNSRLHGISAISANDVWAVGSCPNCKSGTIIEHWDGNSWSVISGASLPQGAIGTLYGVAALSSNNVWAVGQYADYPEGPQTLIEHWDGKRWRVVASPNLSSEYGSDNILRSITALSATDIWAAGMYQNESTDFHQRRTLVQHWDGKSWSIVASPSPGASSELNGLAALPNGTLFGAGLYSDHPVNIYDGTYAGALSLVMKH